MPASRHPRQNCPRKEKCKLVRAGNCPNSHPLCYKAITCKYLRARSCGYYHPPKHFELVGYDKKFMNKLIETSSKSSKNSKNKNIIKNNVCVEYTVDDDSLINAIHPLQKPGRHHKPWEKWEDEKLVKFMNESNNFKHPKAIKQFANEFQRTENGVSVRIQKIKNTKKTKQAENKANSKDNISNQDDDDTVESDSSEDSSSSTDVSDSNSGSPFLVRDKDKSTVNKLNKSPINKPITKKCQSLDSGVKIDEEVMNIFKDLKIYYDKIKNGFEIRNINNLIERIGELKWNNITELENIMGCDIKYFKDKLNGMKDKYGVIDKEMKIKTINVLENVKMLCENEIKNINNIMKNINNNCWLGDVNEFQKISNYNLCYFENIKTVMNGGKIGVNNNVNIGQNKNVLNDILINDTNGNDNENENENDINEENETFIEKRRLRGLSVDSSVGVRPWQKGNNNYRQRNYNSYNKNNRNKYYNKGGYHKQYNDRKRNRSYRNDQFYPNSKRTRYNMT